MMISIHKDKNGQWDFGISAAIAFLTFEEMQELRAMTIVAIGTAEEMFRMGNESQREEKEAKVRGEK